MLYEFMGIIRPEKLADVKEIARAVGYIILRNNGVIRGISNWGVYAFPKPVTLAQEKHVYGHHIVMRYDASAAVHKEIRTLLRKEARLIREIHVKLGDGKLETQSKFRAPEWMSDANQV